MTRRWIVGKDRRICPNACQGWSAPTCKVEISNPETGTFRKKCRECGAEETGQLDSFKERRPCKRCKVVHDVTVSMWHGTRTERWKEQCSLCDLEVSAAHHQAMARTFFARAAKLRAEQQRKAIKAEASASVKSLVMSEINRGAAPALAANETIRELVAAEEASKREEDLSMLIRIAPI